QEIFNNVMRAAQHHMSQPPYDNSHDWEHILRVCSLALKIYESELASNKPWAQKLNPTVIFMACIVHDVGDHKYLRKNENPDTIRYEMLVSCGVQHQLALDIQTIAEACSYTGEIANPSHVQSLLTSHPEIVIVQDADRLDGLGCVGSARCFAFGGASETRKYKSLNLGVQLNWKRFWMVMQLIKTRKGKELARVKWQ
ncbi:hypothetical protein K491DRAFT_574931, partial [Lophiostoma macrostomum CBS 122681]